MSLELLSEAFSRGQTIPLAHGCYGENVSPRFTWRGLPEDARSLVMILEAPDLPDGVCTHWILFDIPVDVDGLLEGTSIGLAGQNDLMKGRYCGPCPRRGSGPYHCVFRLFALDVGSLGLEEGVERSAVEMAMNGHVLSAAEYSGCYECREDEHIVVPNYRWPGSAGDP